ncbi:MAG: ABC transporter permease [Prosthecobacter sp.]|jgi:lipoprotein-releasing system permease protein|uniref:FtsX-like permease family protein n=1 Tax=Prosthecobacter sp. TaxID=1965333 RepID=UPI001A06C040|nr:FtsX-like permease family protein [Prosthecobacter sp.]MBE2287127.1 ABC transporter permease [Prosthecobacter sp.]
MTSAPLFLALRYLRPTRSFISVITVISMLGVMLGVGVLVFVMSVFSGWQREFRQMLLGFEPHAMVQPMTSREEAPQTDWRKLRDALAARPEVVSAIPVAEDVVVVENAGSLQGVSVIGMAEEADNALLKKLTKHLKEGKFDLSGDSIVLSDKFAKELGAKIGDTLVVHAADSVNQFIRQVREIPEDAEETKRAEALDNVTVLSKDLTLVATLRADTAGERGYVPLHVAQEFFNLEGSVSGIELELKDPDNAEPVMEMIYRAGIVPETWGWRTWMQQHGVMLESVENQRTMMWFLLLFIMLVAAICVMNTTITVTVKKRREIGILTALGTRAWQIISIFVSQAGIVALVGVVAGLAGGFFFLSIRNKLRDLIADLTGRDIFPQDIYFLSQIPAHTDASDLLTICATAVALCLLAALVPAWFAARVDPAVALRDGG